ncbi:MAG: hypothetical protein Q9170_001230 [Blastenia crenularia]
MTRPSFQKNPKADPRFANIQTDPRFRLPSKKNTHVRIDKRFERLLRDEAFSSRAKVDRYGRKLPKDAAKKELERYYRIEEDQDVPAGDKEVELELERANGKLREEENTTSAEESSSEEEGDLDVSEGEEVFGLLDGPEADGEGIPLGEVTSRLAAVNMDWENIRAADLMAVFSSFVSNAEQIRKVSIYPSDFGKERMEREEMGPPKEIYATGRRSSRTERSQSATSKDQDDDLSSGEEGDEEIKESLLQEDTGQDFDSAKLRRYQLERLKYYCAVADFSSPAVAQNIYEAVDGAEYLTTANFFDLRFIPDDMDFSQEKPKDECTQIPDGYRPHEFVTPALQHSKVKLTWDAEDATRKEVQKRAFAASRANIDENDLRAYLGSDTSDDEGDGPEPIVVDATATDAPESKQSETTISEAAPKLSKKEAERQRMRALLGLDSNLTTTTNPKKSTPKTSAPVGDMQITFSSGLSSQPNPNSVFTNSPNDPEETTVERYVRKEKERKARRKAKTKALREGGATEENATEPPDHNSSNDGEHPEEDGQGQDYDLGFSDSFFTNPDTTAPKTPAHRKEAKRLNKAQRAAEEAASAAQRAELELLTMPDDDPTTANGTSIQHFDMNEILRAERAIAKSKKRKTKGKDSEREKEALKLKEEDKFRVDVRDPRFEAVFERPEFAIDPSHPRFLETEGMREFLEEGRRKRNVGVEEGDGVDVKRKKRREERGADENGSDREDVGRLIERVKRKSKTRPV